MSPVSRRITAHLAVSEWLCHPAYLDVTCLGNRESQSYNEGVFKNNLRHAILGQIRAPPEGFTFVTRSHFFHKRESLIKVL